MIVTQDADALLRVKQLVHDVHLHIWQNGETERIAEYYHEDAKIHGLIHDVVLGQDELGNAIQHLFMFARVKSFECKHVLTDGERDLAYQIDLDLLHLPTQRTARMRLSACAKLKEGKICEVFAVIDFLSLLEQLQLVPDGALLLGLTGTEMK